MEEYSYTSIIWQGKDYNREEYSSEAESDIRPTPQEKEDWDKN